MTTLYIHYGSFDGIWDASRLETDNDGELIVEKRGWRGDWFRTAGDCTLTKKGFYQAFLRCHDKSKTRKECGRRLRQEVIEAFGSDATDLRRADLWGSGYINKTRMFAWSDGYSSTCYHALVKRCAEYFCVPVGEIQKLPLYGAEEREEHHRYEAQQQGEFYSRHRNCEA